MVESVTPTEWHGSMSPSLPPTAGNTNLVYCMIRSRAVFKQLMNLTVEDCHIGKQRKEGSPPTGARGEGQSPSSTLVEGGPEGQPSTPPPPQQEGENGSETRTVEVEIHPQGREESQGVPPPSEESQGVPPPGEDLQGVSPLSKEPQGGSPVSNHGDNGQGVVPQGSGSHGNSADSEDSQGVPPQSGAVLSSVGVSSEHGARRQAVPDIPTPEVPLETVEVRTEPTSAMAQAEVRPAAVAEGRTVAKTEPGDTIVTDPLKVLDKGKRLGSADLLPLTQGVASNNAKLVEPHVPTDFTPTAEWVSPWYSTLDVCACLGALEGLAPTPLSSPPLPSPASQLLHWKEKLPLQTIQRLLHVLVPQVEKLCMEK